MHGFSLTVHPHQKHAVWLYCAPVNVGFAQTSRRLYRHLHGGGTMHIPSNCTANGEKHEKRVQGAHHPQLKLLTIASPRAGRQCAHAYHPIVKWRVSGKCPLECSLSLLN